MDDDDFKNVGMSPTNGCNDPGPSLDDLAARVRHAAIEEAEAAEEFNVLRRLSEKAKVRYEVEQQARFMAERDLRDAYGEACKP